MKVKTIVCGPLDVNCYVLYSDETKECCAIDPAAAEPVLKFIRENELICTHILLTHGHFDHIGGVAQLKKETGAKVCIHKDDAGMLISDHESFAVVANRHIEPAPADICFSGGESLKIAGAELNVIHTPGHSRGGTCYLCKHANALFTGDTLFRLSIGRSDFPGSNEEALYRSIIEKLFALDANYDVLPGHMQSSTLVFEREHNPYLRKYKGQQW